MMALIKVVTLERTHQITVDRSVLRANLHHRDTAERDRTKVVKGRNELRCFPATLGLRASIRHQAASCRRICSFSFWKSIEFDDDFLLYKI